MFDIIEVPQLQWLRPSSLASIEIKATSASIVPTREKEEPKMTACPTVEIQNIANAMLEGCQFPFAVEPYNHAFHALCVEECVKKGYPEEIQKHIESGVYLLSGYLHLSSQATQIWIALFTAIAISIDFLEDASYIPDLEKFAENLVGGTQQGNVQLDAFARLLKEIPLHFNGLQAQIVLTSSINFIAGCLIELKTSGEKPPPNAQRFAEFYRIRSGAPEAYAMFIFPPEVPIEQYIQAVPEICIIVNNLNDVLSFYKEELRGEAVNYISLQSESRGQSKIETLRQVANDVCTCHQRIITLLSVPSARSAYQLWGAGYVAFHASYDKRYRLNELEW